MKVYVSDTAPLKDKNVFEALYQTVSSDRQKKIDALRLDRDKRLCLAAGLLLKKGLSCAGISSCAVQRGSHGKPYIKGRDIFFNLSHSEEMVMCAIGSKEIGCDVEKIKDMNLKIAKRFFHPAEYEAITGAQSPEAQRDLFFRLWTLKESFIKATGLGMKLPLDSFRIDISEENITVHQSLNQNRYYCKEYHINSGYKYAVCSLTDDFADAEFVSLI